MSLTIRQKIKGGIFTSDDLIDLRYECDILGGVIWVMSEEYYLNIRSGFRKDGAGERLFQPSELSGYGTLLGIKIAIVDFDHIGLAKI